MAIPVPPGVRLFAVIDAAHFDDLQAELSAAKLDFQPLYLDELEAGSGAAGPHLLPALGDAQVTAIESVVGDRLACVWWLWPDEGDAETALYRHLRALNMIEIPRDRFDAEPGERRRGYETVLFRHADPKVLATLLPVLEPEQKARLFGKAKAIRPGAGMLVDPPPDDAVSPRGRLRLSHAQYETIVRGRATPLHEQVALYLRRATPNRAAEHGGHFFESTVSRSVAEWRKRGFVEDISACRLALLAFATDGSFLDESLERLLDGATPSDDIDGRIAQAFEGFRARLEV